MSEEEIIKDVVEIVELAKEEIENNNESILATLDLQDLKSLNGLLDLYQKEKEKTEELRNQNVELRDELEEKNKEIQAVEAKNQIAQEIVHSMENDLMLKNGEAYFVPIAKIKVKIEELEEDIKNYEPCTTVWYQLSAEIDALQELLEEE